MAEALAAALPADPVQKLVHCKFIGRRWDLAVRVHCMSAGAQQTPNAHEHE